MEWVETTGKTVEEAKELALDQLGVGADEAEFEVLDAPRPGLFGRMRGEARVRSRVRPADVRPKRERRRRRGDDGSASDSSAAPAAEADEGRTPSRSSSDGARPSRRRSGGARSRPDEGTTRAGHTERPAAEGDGTPVDPDAVGVAALGFVDGLIDAMGLEATSRLDRDDAELEVAVEGDGLGLLIGPGGQTLLAVQSLARVAAQRRLGDHDTRLRIDVAGYRAKRKVALEQFVVDLARQVAASGVARSMEPMPSADRKIVHDALAEVPGVDSRSVGEDPDRRVIVSPSDDAASDEPADEPDAADVS